MNHYIQAIKEFVAWLVPHRLAANPLLSLELRNTDESIQLGEFRLKKIESAFNRHMRSLGALSALSQVAANVRPAELSQQLDSAHLLEKLNSWPVAEMKLTSNRVNEVLEKDAECLSMN